MKLNRSTLYVALLSSLLMAALFASSAAAAQDPFKGIWYSIDTDSSNQRLTLGGGPAGTYRLTLYDDGATVCNADLSVAAFGTGMLSAAGDVLSGTVSLLCLASPTTEWGDAAISFTYDSASDTLTDNFGVVWHR